MRLVTIALMVLIAWVQAELWFGKAGVAHVHEMSGELAQLKAANDAARGATTSSRPRSPTSRKAWRWSRRRRAPNWA